MHPNRLTKEQTCYLHENAHLFFIKGAKNCNKSRILDLFTVNVAWIYKFEPQRRVSNKQWLSRHVIVYNKKRGEKFQMPYF